MMQRFFQILIGVVFGLVALMFIKTDGVQAACPGGSSCRAYSVADVTDATNYTAIHG